jgi:hypothetical protein
VLAREHCSIAALERAARGLEVLTFKEEKMACIDTGRKTGLSSTFPRLKGVDFLATIRVK